MFQILEAFVEIGAQGIEDVFNEFDRIEARAMELRAVEVGLNLNTDISDQLTNIETPTVNGDSSFIDAFSASIERQNEVLDGAGPAVIEYNNRLEMLDAALADGTINFEQFAAGATSAVEVLERIEAGEAASEMERLAEETERLNDKFAAFSPSGPIEREMADIRAALDSDLELSPIGVEGATARLSQLQAELDRLNSDSAEREIQDLIDEVNRTDAITKLENRLDDLNEAIARTGVATPQLARAVSQTTDALNRANTAAGNTAGNLGKMSNSGATDFLFQLAFFADDAQFGLQGVTNNIPILIQRFNSLSASAAANNTTVFRELGTAASGLAGSFTSLAPAAGSALGPVAAVGAALLAIPLAAYAQDSDRFSASISALGVDLSDVTELFELAGDSANSFIEFLVQATGADIDFRISGIDEYIDELKELQDELRGVDAETREYQKAVEDLDFAITSASLRGQRDRVDDLKEQRAELEALREETQRLRDVSEEREESLRRQASAALLFQSSNIEVLQTVEDLTNILLFGEGSLDDYGRALSRLTATTSGIDNPVAELEARIASLDLILTQQRAFELDTSETETALASLRFELDELQRLPQSTFAASIILDSRTAVDKLQAEIREIEFNIGIGAFEGFELEATQRIQNIREQIEDLQEQPFEEFTNRNAINAIQERIENLALLQDAGRITATQFAAFQEQLETELQDLQDPFAAQARQLTDSFREPLDILEEDISEIQKLFESTDTLDINVRDEAIDDLIDKYLEAEAAKQQLARPISAAEFGSSSFAALDAEIQASFQNENNLAAQRSELEALADSLTNIDIDQAPVVNGLNDLQNDLGGKVEGGLKDVVDAIQANNVTDQDINITVNAPAQVDIN